MYIILLFLAPFILATAWYMLQLRERVSGLAAHLQSAAWDLVRQMENNPRYTAGKNRTKWTEEYKALVLEAADSLTRVPNIYVGQLEQPVALTGAIDTIKKSDDESSSFWFKVQGTRNGLQVFLDLMVLRNPTSAYIRMTDHMCRQRDEFENKGKKASPNHTAMKLALGLPTEWPTGDLPERCLAKGIEETRALNLVTAAKRHKRRILAKLHYKVWTLTDERPEFHGEELLLAMRDYIR